MKNTNFGLFILITLLSAAVNVAQEPAATNADPQEASKKRRERVPPPLPEFVIEVKRPEGCIIAPVFSKTKRGFLVYALPRPPRYAPDRAGQPITSKVSVSAVLQGEQWDVKVWIGKGEFYDAGEIKVGEFKLNLNQRVTVSDFTRFGLSPIRVGVAKVLREEANKPTFASNVASVAVEAMEVNDLPDPHKVQLRNNSGSDLVAIQYNTFRGYRFLELRWWSPGLLKPLIKAGESHKLSVNSEDNSCGDDEGYRPNQTDRFELVSAVFADGSYEGQTGLATLIKGTAYGNRRQLERVAETLRFYAAAEPAEIASQLNYLREQMTEDAEPYMIEQVRGTLLNLQGDARFEIGGFIRSGMHEVKVNLMRDVQYFEAAAKRENSEQAGQVWLKYVTKKYRRWLMAARNMTGTEP